MTQVDVTPFFRNMEFFYNYSLCFEDNFYKRSNYSPILLGLKYKSKKIVL